MKSESSHLAALSKKFYQEIDRDKTYPTPTDPVEHPFYELLKKFIIKWNLKSKKCLEIGSSIGIFQDLIDNYTGVDVAEPLSEYYHKEYVAVPAAKLPFPNESFDAIFTLTTHEHIFDLETALQEIVRILKPGGVCLFAPAWHTRPWFAQGYEYRPYKDLPFREKFIKFSIPYRDFVLIRWPIILFRRFFRLCIYVFSEPQHRPLKYKQFKPNYEVYWQSDSDACNSLDPFDVIVWFRCRGFVCHGYRSLVRTLLVRTRALELQKPFT